MSQTTKLGLLAFGIVFGGFLLAGAIVGGLVLARGGSAGGTGAADRPGPGVKIPASGRPQADREGLTWNFKELIAYFESCGIPMPIDSYGSSVASTTKFEAKSVKGSGMIYQHPTAQAAHDAASDADSFSWGRFRFDMRGDRLPVFKAALGI